MSADGRLRLSGSDRALFASDMHLGDHDSQTAEWFFASLEAQSPGITHLILLGDIFEAWVGDDQPDKVAEQLSSLLNRLAGRGVHVALMRGNRDFLLGVEQSGGSPASWPERCGAQLLDDPTVVDLFGMSVLLAHGDAWCTDDHGYQRFRAEVRSPAWQQSFLARPLAERLTIARAMREQSERNRLENDPGDVNRLAVIAALDAGRAARAIHGHTHRPGRYALAEDPARTDLPERWVLPDWSGAARRGGWLTVTEEGWSFGTQQSRAISEKA